MKSNKEIAAIIFKILNGEINSQEKEDLEEWLACSPENQQILENLKNIGGKEIFLFDTNISDSKYKKMVMKQDEKHAVHLLKKRSFNYQRAARSQLAFTLLAACIILLIIVQPSAHVKPSDTIINGKKPDTYSNKIVLQLADNRLIYLDTIGDYILSQGAYRLSMHDNELRYMPGNDQPSGNEQEAFNAVLVPEGRRFTVILPDESTVLLNAVSSIRFPVSGNGKKRTIELTGEAFFKINAIYSGKNKIPFVVNVKTLSALSQKVTVTGTTFNINAYCDDPVIKTSLLEGKVLVESKEKAVFLNPGEEIQIGETSWFKRKARAINEVTAWKDDYFVFNDAPVRNVLNEVGRWYGRNVEIDGDQSDRISLTTSRSTRFEFILESLCRRFNYKVRKKGNRIRLIKRP